MAHDYFTEIELGALATFQGAHNLLLIYVLLLFQLEVVKLLVSWSIIAQI